MVTTLIFYFILFKICVIIVIKKLWSTIMSNIKLTEDMIWSYANCPVQYDLIYNRKIIPPETITLRYYLMKVINYFFLNLMNGEVTEPSKLKDKWDLIWKENVDYIDSNKGIDGLSKIMLLYKWAEKEKLRILDMSIPYKINFIGKNNSIIELTGEIPVISINNSDVCELLYIDTGNALKEQLRLDMDLKFTLYSYVYYKQTGKQIGIKLHNLKQDKDLFSYRGKTDYQRLHKTIVNIAEAISNNIYYPRENIMCKTCLTAGACRMWC